MSIAIGPTTVLAQASGTPSQRGYSIFGSDPYGNPFNVDAWKTYYGGSGGFPSWQGDTRKWDAFSGDMSFAWDDGHGGICIAYGDTFGFTWIGTFAKQTSGPVGTIGAGSNGLDLTTLNGTTSLYINTASGSITGWNIDPHIVAVRCSDGAGGEHFAFIGFSGVSNSGGTHLVNAWYINGTGSGTFHAATGNVAGMSDRWAGLIAGHDCEHRDNIVLRSTDTNLTNGCTITSAPCMTQWGTAPEAVPATNSGLGPADIYTGTPVAYSSIVINPAGYATVNATAHGLKTGQPFYVTGMTTYTADGEYSVWSSPGANSFIFFIKKSGLSATITSGAVLAPCKNSQTNVRNPHAATINLCPPTGGISMPTASHLGSTRQYLFYQRIRLQLGFWFNSMMGVAILDDQDGDTSWTEASQSGTFVSATYSGGTDLAHLATLTASAQFVAGLVVGSTIEVDTVQGRIAHLSVTGVVGGNQFTISGVALGTGTDTLDTSCGVRFMCFANNATYSNRQQQAMPWRPGDGYIYFFCCMNGRGQGGINSAAGMMRCPEASILDKSTYTYWTGWSTKTWSTDPEAAGPLFNDGTLQAPGVSEPSWFWHDGIKSYVAIYLIQPGGIVVRFADAPEGPWTPSQQIFYKAAGSYGGCPHPWSTVGGAAAATGPTGTVTTSISSGSQSPTDLVWFLSVSGPYGTYAMHTSLTRYAPSAPPGGLAVSGAQQMLVGGLA